MRTWITTFVTLCLLFSGINVQPAQAVDDKYVVGTDEAASLFNPLEIREIKVEIPENQIPAINGNTDIYHQAYFTLTTESAIYGPLEVGLRLKGSSSFQTLHGKPSLKIRFNEFVKGQKLLGLKRLTLNAMNQDPSMIRETLAYRLYRELGVPASRTGFSNVQINDTNYGLYLMLETVDRKMLKNWFADTQHLYNGALGADFVPANLNEFEVSEGNKTEKIDLAAFLSVQLQSDQNWYQAFKLVTNEDQFITHMALDLYLGMVDSFVFTQNPNYYLHFDSQGTASMIPWGTDQTWKNRLAFTPKPSSSIIHSKCVSDLECKTLFEQKILAISEIVISADFLTMANEVSTAIAAAQLGDSRRSHTQAEAEKSKQDLIHFLGVRKNDVSRELYMPKKPDVGIVRAGKNVTINWVNNLSTFIENPSAEISYRVNAGPWVTTWENQLTTKTLEFEPNSKVDIKVRAWNNLIAGVWSDVLSIKIPDYSSVTSLKSVLRGSKFNVSWLTTKGIDVLAHQAQLQVNDGSWETIEVGVNKTFELNAQLGVNYKFKIRTLSDIGYGLWSETLVFGVPKAPVISKVIFQETGNNLKISWSKQEFQQSKIIGYEITRSSNGVKWEKSKTVTSPSAVYTNTKGKLLYFRVRLVTELGEGDWSIPFVKPKK